MSEVSRYPQGRVRSALHSIVGAALISSPPLRISCGMTDHHTTMKMPLAGMPVLPLPRERRMRAVDPLHAAASAVRDHATRPAAHLGADPAARHVPNVVELVARVPGAESP
jgi:hypothetical protein